MDVNINHEALKELTIGDLLKIEEEYPGLVELAEKHGPTKEEIRVCEVNTRTTSMSAYSINGRWVDKSSSAQEIVDTA